MMDPNMEITTAERTNLGTKTKYAKKEINVFGDKDIRTEILPRDIHPDMSILTSLQEDISWSNTPVSILSVKDILGETLPDVRFRDQDTGVAVLQRLKHKYVGLESDEMGDQVDTVEDMETGLFKIFSKEEPDLMIEMPSVKPSIVSKIRSMQQSNEILTTVIRFNGMNCPEMTENLCNMERCKTVQDRQCGKMDELSCPKVAQQYKDKSLTDFVDQQD
jgi:hypothetical protein